MKKLTCILFFLLPLFLHAQQTNVDSLVNVLNTQKLTVLEQCKLNFKICEILLSGADGEKSMAFAKRGLAFAEKENNKTYISKFYDWIGRVYGTRGINDTAVIYFNKSLEVAKEIKDKEREACIYINLGVTYRSESNYSMALEYYMKALPIYESMDSKNGKINCSIILTNIANIHSAMKNKKQALYYLEKAKTIIESTDDQKEKIRVYFHLGAMYENEPEKLLENMQKVYENALAIGEKISQGASLQGMSVAYGQMGNYEKAIECAERSLSLGKEIGNKRLIIDSYVALSSVYFDQGKWKECDAVSSKAWEVDTTDLGSGYETLFGITYSNIYLNNKNKAATFLKKFYDIIQKGPNDEKLQEDLANMEVKYETQKKEIRIAALEKERKLYIILGIAVVAALLFGLGLLFYRHRLSIQKQKQLEQENELIAARSALDAEKAEREIIARDLHDGVGAMLSVVKNNMNIMKSYSVIDNKEVDYFNKALDGVDKSIVELRRVAHHIMPAVLMEKGLFAALDDFCRSIPEAEFHYTDPECRFDSEKELVLYRCAYELVNNAMKHAKATKIEVHLNVDETKAYLSVVDNGCGFDLQNAPQGMGIKNLRTRLSAFGGNMDIYSGPGKGTEVNVELTR